MSVSLVGAVFLGIMLLGVWVVSSIVVLSYTRYQSALKYLHSVVVFPLVVLGVWLGVYLSAEFIGLFVNSDYGKAMYLLLVVVAVVLLVPAVLTAIFFLWLRLLGFLDSQYSRY